MPECKRSSSIPHGPLNPHAHTYRLKPPNAPSRVSILTGVAFPLLPRIHPRRTSTSSFLRTPFPRPDEIESVGFAVLNFPKKIAAAASLTIDYKAPTKADQFVVIRCHLAELKGRKAIVEGSIEHLNGTVLATAKNFFIQPRYAKLFNTKTITKIVGEPPVAVARLGGGDPAPVPPDGKVEA